VRFGRTPRPRTVAQRLAGGIDRVLRALVHDRGFAIATFSAWRSKEPLLEALASSWTDEPVDTLLALTPEQLLAVEAFYREHARFAIWAATTDAMPATLEARYDTALALLLPLGHAAIEALGGVVEDDDAPQVPPGWGTLRR
jgi:hypothetical protein